MSTVNSKLQDLEVEAAKESDQHPCSYVLTGGSAVYQMDTTHERYQQLSDSFFQNWTKANTTGIQIEGIWKVIPNRLQRDRYELYKRTVSESLNPSDLNEKSLFHGTNSCLAMKIYNQRMKVLQDSDLGKARKKCATVVITCGFWGSLPDNKSHRFVLFPTFY